jgi:hypothetical protein
MPWGGTHRLAEIGEPQEILVASVCTIMVQHAARVVQRHLAAF